MRWMLGLFVFLMSCTQLIARSDTVKTYKLNKEYTVTPGERIASITEIEGSSADSLSEIILATSFKIELIYLGISGTEIKILYREYKDGLARQAFFLESSYDLALGKEIRFQRFSIEVVSVDNLGLVYKVLADEKDMFKPPKKAPTTAPSSSPSPP